MAFKEGMTQEEYDADILEVSTKAKEGLFGEEDLNKRVQSETDKVRQDLYKTKIKPLEEELTKLKPKEKTDAEKELEQRLADLETKQQEVAKKEKILKVQETLTSANLPKELSKYLAVGNDDIETSIAEIGNVLNQYRLDNSFKPTNHKKTEGITKEQFHKMGYLEREKLEIQNPELFKRLNQK